MKMTVTPFPPDVTRVTWKAAVPTSRYPDFQTKLLEIQRGYTWGPTPAQLAPGQRYETMGAHGVVQGAQTLVEGFVMGPVPVAQAAVDQILAAAAALS